MGMKRLWSTPKSQFLLMLLAASGVSLVLFLADSLHNHSTYFSYLIWNLFLAWLPLIFSAWLVSILGRKLWSSWEAIAASLLWLIFLPNSFYMVSDYIHLREVSEYDLLFDAVMLTSFISVAVVLGICSLYAVHQEVLKRFSRTTSTVWLLGTLLLCSFAIYLGRDLRWNSWDILVNPGGLLFDTSERFLHPAVYPEMFLTTGIFMLLIGMFYGIGWFSVRLIRSWPAKPQIKPKKR